MSAFIFLMQHAPSSEQILSAQMIADRILVIDPAKIEMRIEGLEYFGRSNLLNVPDDSALEQGWFVNRACEILTSHGGVRTGDYVHVMGQQQLVQALNALYRMSGAGVLESVTPRESVDVKQLDGSVKKESVFRFKGFREVFKF